MAEDESDFDAMIADAAARSKQVHEGLARRGYRVFSIRIDVPTIGEVDPDGWLWIHDGKTVAEWRQDIRDFVQNVEVLDEDGRAHGNVENTLGAYLRQRGYIEVADVVSDVFDGRIATAAAKLLPNPSRDSTGDGFGEFGLEREQPAD